MHVSLYAAILKHRWAAALVHEYVAIQQIMVSNVTKTFKTVKALVRSTAGKAVLYSYSGYRCIICPLLHHNEDVVDGSKQKAVYFLLHALHIHTQHIGLE